MIRHLRLTAGASYLLLHYKWKQTPSLSHLIIIFSSSLIQLKSVRDQHVELCQCRVYVITSARQTSDIVFGAM